MRFGWKASTSPVRPFFFSTAVGDASDLFLPGIGRRARCTVFELRVSSRVPGKKPDALDEHADERRGGLRDPWSNNQRWLLQNGKNLSGAYAADAMALEQFFDLCLAQPGRPSRGRHLLPQRENPFVRKIGTELEHLRIIAPELFT